MIPLDRYYRPTRARELQAQAERLCRWVRWLEPVFYLVSRMFLVAGVLAGLVLVSCVPVFLLVLAYPLAAATAGLETVLNRLLDRLRDRAYTAQHEAQALASTHARLHDPSYRLERCSKG
jgi:hypothetical protein